MLHKARLGKQGLAKVSFISSHNCKLKGTLQHPTSPSWMSISHCEFSKESQRTTASIYRALYRVQALGWARQTHLLKLHTCLQQSKPPDWTMDLLSEPAVTKLYIFDSLSKEYFPQRLPMKNLKILLLCRTKINLTYFLFTCVLSISADLCSAGDYTQGLVHPRQALTNRGTSLAHYLIFMDLSPLYSSCHLIFISLWGKYYYS